MRSSGLTGPDPGHEDLLSLEELGVVSHFGSEKVKWTWSTSVSGLRSHKPEFSVGPNPEFLYWDLNLK